MESATVRVIDNDLKLAVAEHILNWVSSTLKENRSRAGQHGDLYSIGESSRRMDSAPSEGNRKKKKRANAEEQNSPSKGLITLTDNLKDLFLTEVGSDVTVTVEDREFHVHRLILSARSPVFAAMFYHNMHEKRSGIVNIPDIDSELFRDFLFYIYTAEIPEISTKKAIDLYSVGDRYEVKQLMEDCVQFIKDNVTVENFVEILHIADKEPLLMKSAERFFKYNAGKILVTEEWKEFVKENSGAANDLFIKYVG